MNITDIKDQLRRTCSALAVVGTLFTLPNAEAAPPIPATFSTTDCDHIISSQPAGENTIITLSMTTCFHGTFEGTWVGTERDVVHPDGQLTAQGSGVFSGTVNGRSGTCVFSYTANIGKIVGVNPWVAEQGTGDLAGLHGRGTTVSGIENGPGCPASGFDCVDCPPPTGTCDDSFTLDIVGEIQFAP